MDDNATLDDQQVNNDQGDITPDNDVKDNLAENYKKAMQEERTKRKETQSQLEELQKFKADLEEKEKKKKGQYEEILTEKERIIEDLSQKAKSRDDYQSQKQEQLQKELETVSKEYPAELKEKFSDILDKLDDESKLNFFKKTLDAQKEKQKDESFKTKPSTDGKVIDGQVKPRNLSESISSAKIIS